MRDPAIAGPVPCREPGRRTALAATAAAVASAAGRAGQPPASSAVLVLDGVEPGPQALAAGRYPLAKAFRFVARGEPSAAAAALMRFVSAPGQERRSGAPRRHA